MGDRVRRPLKYYNTLHAPVRERQSDSEREMGVREREEFEYGDGTFEITPSASNLLPANGSSFIVPSECIRPRTHTDDRIRV